MSQTISMNIIARIHTDFPTKFGIPRQSGLADSLLSQIVFEPDYRVAEAFRGLEEFSHLWLIWQFSQAVREGWSPTVRPPRLGGNKRMGVFATRSPFRPNNIGLSSVRLVELRHDPALGPVVVVAGADLMDGTPILDIKPYLPFTDSHPQAAGGFAHPFQDYRLQVSCPPALLEAFPPALRQGLLQVLEQDPRPSYQQDPQRVYGLPFAGWEVRFTVDGDRLTVRDLFPLPADKKL